MSEHSSNDNVNSSDISDAETFKFYPTEEYPTKVHFLKSFEKQIHKLRKILEELPDPKDDRIKYKKLRHQYRIIMNRLEQDFVTVLGPKYEFLQKSNSSEESKLNLTSTSVADTTESRVPPI